MNDMTDTNDRQEDEYEYEYSEYGWIRRLKAASVTCAPLTGLEPNNVTVCLTTTMTAGHPDTTTAVPAADDTCLTQPQSTLSDRKVSCDTDLTEYSEICAGPVIHTGMDPLCPVDCSIVPVCPETDTNESSLDTSVPATNSTRDLHSTLADWTLDTGKDPTSSPGSAKILDSSMHASHSSRDLNSLVDDFIPISPQEDICTDLTNPPSETGIASTPHVRESDMTAPVMPTDGLVDPFAPVVTSNKDSVNSPTETSTVLGALPMDCITPLVHCSVDSLSTSLDISTDSINPETNSNLNVLSDHKESNMESNMTIYCSAVNLIPDTTSELVVDEQILQTVSSLTDKQENTEEGDRQECIKCDSFLLSPATTDLLAKEFQFQCSPDIKEECRVVSEGEVWTQLGTCDSGKTEEDRCHKYFETYFLGQLSENLNDKQEDTVEGDLDTWVKCNSFTVSQSTTDVVAEELQFQCPPDVREEVRVVSEGERWTLLKTCDSGSTGDDEKHAYIQKDYSNQHLESQTPEETHGYQEGKTEESCVAGGDTYDVLRTLHDSSTEDQGVSLECEAKVEQKVLGYCDKHLLVQTAENFATKAPEISSQGDTAKDSHTHPVQCSVDSLSTSLGTSTDNINPATNNNLNLLGGSEHSSKEPISCSAVKLTPDTISELVVDVQHLATVCNLADKQEDTEKGDTHLLVQSAENFTMKAPEISSQGEIAKDSHTYPVQCSVDSLSISLGIRTDNLNSQTNNNLNPEESNMEHVLCSTVNVTPETLSELVVDIQNLTTVSNLTHKQEVTAEGDLEKFMECDSFPTTLAITDVVGEELQFQCSPNVREEVSIVSEEGRWTQLEICDSGSTEEDRKCAYFQTHYVGQSSENLAPEETHGYQEGKTEESCAAGGDTYDVLRPLHDSSTEDQGVSPECEAKVEQKVLGYCDKHLLVQTAENFTMKADEISSQGETAKDSHTHPVQCSVDSLSTSLGTSTDNINPTTNNNHNLLGGSEESSKEPISCSAVKLTPDTISELVVDVQHLAKVCNLADKQEDTEEGDTDNSFLFTQAIVGVVAEELHVLCSPDVKEEVKVVTEGERWTQLETCHSGSTEEEGQHRYFETHYLSQPLENVTDKQEDTVQDDIGIDTHPLTYSFQNSITESHPLIKSGNWDQSETDQNQAAVALGDLGNVSTEEEEGVGFKPTDYGSSSNESWVDAFQFLAGEESEASIFDEWRHPPSVSSCGESTHDTKDLSAPGGTVVTALSEPISYSALQSPPVERWSSTDSWVSALSDWAPALPAHPEDSFLCESLTEASMAIQDQAKEPGPDGSTKSGQTVTTLPQNLLALGGHQSAEVRAEVDVDSRGRTSDPVACCCLPFPSEKTTALSSDMGAACDTFSAGESFTHQSDCPRNLLYGDSYRIPTEAFPDLYHKVQSSLELPYKDSGQQYVKAGTTLWGVTEDGVSLAVLSTEEKGERSYGSLNISDYLSRAAPAEGYSAYAPFLATDTGALTCNLDQTDSHRVSGQENTGSQLQGQNRGFPQFIMPFAPVGQPCLGNSAQRLVSCSLPEDQLGASGLSKDPQAWTNLIGSTFPSFLPPYVRSHLKIHPLLPAVTGELRSPSDTTDTSASWDSSSTSSTSSSSDEQAIPGDLCSVNQESICKASNVRKECDNLLIATGERYKVLEQDRVACLTLDFDSRPYPSQCAEEQEDFANSFNTANPRNEKEHIKSGKMPHKTSKAASEGKSRPKHKNKSGGHHSTTHASKKQENVQPESQSEIVLANASPSEDGAVTVIETIVITEKVPHKSHGKKKKKHHQASTTGKSEVVPLAEVENGAKQKTTKDKVKNVEESAHVDSVKQKATGAKAKIDCFETKLAQRKGLEKVDSKKDTLLSDILPVPRLLDKDTGKIDSKTNDSITADKHGVLHNEPYSSVVQEKTHVPKPVPQVVEDIQAVPVQDDPQSISLKCQFGTIDATATVTWTKGGTTLSEMQKSAGDVSQESLTLLKACSKDLGMYRCTLTCSLGSAYSDFHFTSEVLCELVIPSHSNEVEPTEVMGDEENVQCAPLLFKDDFLSEQYFGEHQPASITTEKEHFGEGMHRKAFRATLKAGTLSDLSAGHPCVLKVHNSISHGTSNIEELVQRNYNLAVEECHVQNTAREYIKAYNNVAKSAESFGELPEIIPIFLVHRPSNDIPYATLEEELRGDFVKYSVKDGKEINLMRRDSEAGQKCCAFQHWVYTITEGNLLVTDMQGVGMKLTDVGIATCKKGYKGFKGNCATSFIDQFKVLHQCNRYCELLGLTSLQPKPKRTAPPAKPKPQPAPKKKTFGPPLKGKS